MKTTSLLSVIVVSMGLAILGAAEPRIVKEINLADAKINGGGMAGNTFLFTNTGDGGEELWASDGTVAGTRQLVDIYPGTASSVPSTFVTLGDGRVAFAADDGSAGIEPWISDGTAAGTQRIGDIHPGEDGSSPHSFLLAGGAVYFIADDGSNGAELWRWDGSSASRVTQLGGGADDGFTLGFGQADFPRGVFDGKAVYATVSSFTAGAVIATDGSGVTTLAASLAMPNPSNTRVPAQRHFQQIGNRLAFLAQDGSEIGLWASDGSANSAVLLKAGQPSGLAVLDGIAYFACQPGDREYGNENNVRGLWRSDGTSGGTQVVTEAINPTYNFYGPQGMIAVGDSLYFSAEEATNQRHLWRSDGTAGGTVKINQTFASPRIGDTQPISGLTDVGGELWFLAGNATIGKEWWRLVDGSTPTMFDQILAGATNLEAAGFPAQVFGGTDRAFMIALDAEEKQVLYAASRGVSTVATIAEPLVGPGDADVMQIRATTDGVFFRADDPNEGERIWFSDGTEAGTIPVLDPKPGIDGAVRPHSEDRMLFDLVQIDRRVFAFIDDGHFPSGTTASFPKGTEPYSIDLDTAAKTPQLIVDTEPGSYIVDPLGFYRKGKGFGVPGESTVLGSYVYFRASQGAAGTGFEGVGTELYRSNGVDSVALAADIVPGTRGGRPRDLTVVNGRLVFIGQNDLTTNGAGNLVRRSEQHGVELWVYDPALESATLLKDINSGTASIFPGTQADGDRFGDRRLIRSGDYIYFPADDGTHGVELWRTDGTTAGTTRLSDLASGGGHGLDWTALHSRWAAPLHNGLIFAGSTGSGEEPYFFDGDEVRRLADLQPGLDCRNPDGFVSIGNWCYFSAENDAFGRELWRTNGLVTERLSDGDPGPRDLDPTGLTRVGRSLVFIGQDGADEGEPGFANPELWEYDGVSVFKVWESDPGDASLGYSGSGVTRAYPVTQPQWAVVGNKLFFTTDQNFARGNELWLYETNGQLNIGSPGRIDLPDGDLTVDEGDGTLTTQLYVTRAGGDNGPVSVRVRSVDGSAVAGSHYQAIDTVLSWADGDTSLKSITVTTFGDTVFTQDRDFSLELSEPAGGVSLGIASKRIIIAEDDSPPVAGALRFAAATIQTVEGDSGTTQITVSVTRRDGSDGAVSVAYATADDSATAGSDYVASSGTLSWAAGDAAVKSFTVTVNGDTDREGDERISLHLTNATGGAVIAQGSSEIIILSDEAPVRRLVLRVGSVTTKVEAVQGFSERYEGSAIEHDIDGVLDGAAGEDLDAGLESSETTIITITGTGNG